MLEQIRIDNFVLIDTIELDFKSTLNVITGESASGKSLVLKAMSFLENGKLIDGIQKDNTKPVRVTAIFTSLDKKIVEEIESYGIKVEGDCVIFNRTLSTESRQSCFIENQRCTTQAFSNVISKLILLSAQMVQSSLFKPKFALNYLDSFSKNDKIVAKVNEEIKKLSFLISEKERLKIENERDNKSRDYLEFVIKEIDNAKLKAGEDEELKKEHDIIKSSFELTEGLNVLSDLFSSSSFLNTQLSNAKGIISKLSKKLDSLSSLDEKISNIYYSIEDLRYDIADVAEKCSFDSDRAQAVEERISLISGLRRKYGSSVDDILHFRDESANKLESLCEFEKRIEALKKDIDKSTTKLIELKDELFKSREKNAKVLDKEVMKILSELSMGYAEFVTSVIRSDDIMQSDTVEFCIRLDKSKEFVNASKVASGGEISRILLSLLCINKAPDCEVEVFDEIDSALGGESANALGKYLNKLSQNVQVISVTHQASIAARAENHIKIFKQLDDKNTTIKSENLEGKIRALEIARMLSGDADETSILYAEKLLKQHNMTKS